MIEALTLSNSSPTLGIRIPLPTRSGEFTNICAMRTASFPSFTQRCGGGGGGGKLYTNGRKVAKNPLQKRVFCNRN